MFSCCWLFNFDNVIADLIGFVDVGVHLLMSNGENKKKAKNGFLAD
jgi:hypothetical protein